MPPGVTIDRPPTGVDPQTVTNYYNWLYGVYLQDIQGQPIGINWNSLFWVFLALFLFGLFTLLLGVGFNQSRRRHGGLYGVSTFAGNILERIGPISLLSWALFAFFVIWAVYFVVTNIVFGQRY